MNIKIELSDYDYKIVEKIAHLRNEEVTQTTQFIVRGFISAQQGVQLTAFGAGWRRELGWFLLRWGWRIWKFGGN
jgi:hypothetical protein